MAERVFITVIGQDQKGIIARIATCLWHADINIEDVSQKITDGYFVMTMLADISETSSSMEQLKAALGALGDDLHLRIQVQHESLFKMMHRV